MSDPALHQFFHERKEGWLKKNIKASMSEGEQQEKQAECEQLFSKERWLPDAAKRAGQISISTHPCTFSHPSSRKNKNGYASSVIATSAHQSDGFLRSGNVEVPTDALGNAAALDVYKFLTLEMEDGQTLLSHLRRDTELARSFFTIKNEHYNSLKKGFLAITNSDEESITSSKIKQVYFPVEAGYHQLSLLTPSGIVFDLRKRLDTLRFGEDSKLAREKKRINEFYETGYKEIYGLTTIGYGGTKPQNISVLNNQNGGKTHLFLSAPPKVITRDIHFPMRDFFSQNLHFNYCRDLFLQLHAIYVNSQNNRHTRADKDEWYLTILDRIVEKSWQVRAVSNDQYRPETSRLPQEQKIWLMDDYQKRREKEDDWLNPITAAVTLFIFRGYEKALGKRHEKLSDGEFRHIEKLIENNKEVLR
ncbi:type I-F CRISPR-associated protein Csy1 [Endozoicomonas sp. (ex Bugula neritina AB1)]|nr:type I-F CRISPR-associated protein Csy1 [Endozoicomonas sp. (ex Bugula neritina AB1)]